MNESQSKYLLLDQRKKKRSPVWDLKNKLWSYEILLYRIIQSSQKSLGFLNALIFWHTLGAKETLFKCKSANEHNNFQVRRNDTNTKYSKYVYNRKELF